jgi:nucleotide-binding universal stress UspA family protein
MEKLLNNILVPVVEGEETAIAIREALRVGDQLKCNVHLLYFDQGTELADTTSFDRIKADMQEQYLSRMGATPTLLITRQTGSPMKRILTYYKRHSIDLILLGRRKMSLSQILRKPWGLLHRTSLVNVSLLLKKVNCPVLTMNGGRAIFGLKNIVLPVGDFLPMRKLLFATYLAKISRSTIHLIAADKSDGIPGSGRTGDHSAAGYFEDPFVNSSESQSDNASEGPVGGNIDESGEASKESLYKSYRLLRENTDLPIRCLTIPGRNLADIAWNYAKRIKADLILVGPGKESLLSGFLHGLRSPYLRAGFSRSLLNVSRIPVMSVR